ncbi:unnamed protein product [Gordionus sp. m RMFG-2023]
MTRLFLDDLYELYQLDKDKNIKNDKNIVILLQIFATRKDKNSNNFEYNFIKKIDYCHDFFIANDESSRTRLFRTDKFLNIYHGEKLFGEITKSHDSSLFYYAFLHFYQKNFDYKYFDENSLYYKDISGINGTILINFGIKKLPPPCQICRLNLFHVNKIYNENIFFCNLNGTYNSRYYSNTLNLIQNVSKSTAKILYQDIVDVFARFRNTLNRQILRVITKESCKFSKLKRYFYHGTFIHQKVDYRQLKTYERYGALNRNNNNNHEDDDDYRNSDEKLSQNHCSLHYSEQGPAIFNSHTRLISFGLRKIKSTPTVSSHPCHNNITRLWNSEFNLHSERKIPVITPLKFQEDLSILEDVNKESNNNNEYGDESQHVYIRTYSTPIFSSPDRNILPLGSPTKFSLPDDYLNVQAITNNINNNNEPFDKQIVENKINKNKGHNKSSKNFEIDVTKSINKFDNRIYPISGNVRNQKSPQFFNKNTGLSKFFDFSTLADYYNSLKTKQSKQELAKSDNFSNTKSGSSLLSSATKPKILNIVEALQQSNQNLSYNKASNYLSRSDRSDIKHRSSLALFPLHYNTDAKYNSATKNINFITDIASISLKQPGRKFAQLQKPETLMKKKKTHKKNGAGIASTSIANIQETNEDDNLVSNSYIYSQRSSDPLVPTIFYTQRQASPNNISQDHNYPVIDTPEENEGKTPRHSLAKIDKSVLHPPDLIAAKPDKHQYAWTKFFKSYKKDTSRSKITSSKDQDFHPSKKLFKSQPSKSNYNEDDDSILLIPLKKDDILHQTSKQQMSHERSYGTTNDALNDSTELPYLSESSIFKNLEYIEKEETRVFPTKGNQRPTYDHFQHRRTNSSPFKTLSNNDTSDPNLAIIKDSNLYSKIKTTNDIINDQTLTKDKSSFKNSNVPNEDKALYVYCNKYMDKEKQKIENHEDTIGKRISDQSNNNYSNRKIASLEGLNMDHIRNSYYKSDNILIKNLMKIPYKLIHKKRPENNLKKGYENRVWKNDLERGTDSNKSLLKEDSEYYSGDLEIVKRPKAVFKPNSSNFKNYYATNGLKRIKNSGDDNNLKQENAGYRLFRRKALFEKRKKLSDWCLILAVIGLVLMIFENELFYRTQSPKAITIIVAFTFKVLITISTIMLLILLIYYYKTELRIFKVENFVEDWRVAITSKGVLMLIIELAICCIHPVPKLAFLKYLMDRNKMAHYYFNDDNEDLQTNSTVHLTILAPIIQNDLPIAHNQTDVILSVLMFSRLYLVGRALLLHSKMFSDTSSRSIGALNKIKFNTQFIFKTLMTMYPVTVLLSLMISWFLLASWILRTCERQHDPNNANIFNAFWLTSITFLAIGYGDLVPNTYCGRGISVCTGIMGAGCTALVVAVLAKKLELTKAEKHVHNFMMDTQYTKRLKHAAANVLRETWLIYKFTKLTQRSNVNRIRKHQRKFLAAIKNLRQVKTDQRKLLDSQNALIDIAKV